MKLIDLSPVWLEHEGRRVAIMFRCPCCIPKKRWFLTCFFEATGTLPKGTADDIVQAALAQAGWSEDEMVVGCNPKAAWSRTGDDFSSLSIHPSIDASASGHWHGHIVSGEIR